MPDVAFSPRTTWTFWQVVWATLVFACLGLSFWLLYRFSQVVFTLFVALMLGTILRPAVSALQRRGLPGNVAVILIYLLLLALVVGFGVLVVPLIVTQATTIVAATPDYLQTASDWLLNNPNPLIGRLGDLFTASLSPDQSPLQQSGQQILDIAGQALEYIGSASQGFLTAVAILLIAFYWTLDGPRYVRSLVLLLPKGNRDSTQELIGVEGKIFNRQGNERRPYLTASSAVQGVWKKEKWRHASGGEGRRDKIARDATCKEGSPSRFSVG